MEQPILRLGLLGFPDSVSSNLQMWAAQNQPGWPQWRVGDPHQADAWMISGASVDVQGRDGIVVQHPYGGTERLTLHRSEVDRPLAFGYPLPEGFVSAEYFEAEDEKSVRQRLQRFEAWLRPLRSQFTLGALLVDRLQEFKNGVVHLVLEGRLLAVIDLTNWRAGLHIPARPVDLEMGQWISPPGVDNDIPPSFIKLSLNRLMWIYAARTQRDVLPPRYREQTIYLRRVPRLPARWFDDMHMRLMRELAVRPGPCTDLVSRIGGATADIEHHLAALYYAGGLTTDPDTARRAEPSTRRELVALQFNPVGAVQEVPLSSEFGDLNAPSTALREMPHSPLRVLPSTPKPAAFQ